MVRDDALAVIGQVVNGNGFVDGEGDREGRRVAPREAGDGGGDKVEVLILIGLWFLGASRVNVEVRIRILKSSTRVV